MTDDAPRPELIATTDGRVPGRRGRATRQRLLECTAELLVATPWRSIKVIDIARQAGTSPATFYQYFENVEAAITVLAEELVEGAVVLAGLVDGDWSEEASWDTAVAVVEGFMDYWERNRAVFRVVELTTVEGDLRFQGLRVRALNAVTVTLARVIATAQGRARVPGRVPTPWPRPARSSPCWPRWPATATASSSGGSGRCRWWTARPGCCTGRSRAGRPPPGPASPGPWAPGPVPARWWGRGGVRPHRRGEGGHGQGPDPRSQDHPGPAS
jgi:AcrR family transcriptional regulator